MIDNKIDIKFLVDCEEAISPIANLWFDELSQHFVPNASVQRNETQLREHLHKNALPLAMIAWYDQKPIGMACLRNNDGIRPDLSPWLGSLVVHPDYRGKKIGEALINSIKNQAKLMGYEDLYLFAFDPTIPTWYAQLGWQYIASDEFFKKPVVVMKTNLI